MILTENTLKKVLKRIMCDPDSNIALKKMIEDKQKELKELELKRSLEEREIKHLVRMKEEKQEIEYNKREIELQKSFQELEMKLQTQYHDKVVKLIQTEHGKIQEIYGKIMERLPNVNMEIKRGR